jgi:hypothetical protein
MQYLLERFLGSEAIVHSFCPVAYVWVRGAKTTGPIMKKFGFS